MRKTKLTFTLAGVAIVVSMAAFISGKVAAMDREELRNVPPQVRNWFETMRSPSGKLCCSYADGHRTEYDMRENAYWVPINEVWTPIPPEVVIYDQGNPFSEAVVWYNPIIENGKPTGQHKILCFVPGGGS
jgi:hypothetical protein